MIVARYRGSALGLLWALVTPAVMIAVFTFLFAVFIITDPAKWPVTVALMAADAAGAYQLVLPLRERRGMPFAGSDLDIAGQGLAGGIVERITRQRFSGKTAVA